MHPVERLRMVAGARAAHQSGGRGAHGDDPGLIAREAAASLAGLGHDPMALVTACRRLVDHQPACGPLWWLAARVLTAADPETEARRSAHDLADDPTPAVVAEALPDEAVVTVVGSPEQVTEALGRRPDLTVLVVDAEGEGSFLVSMLNRCGGRAVLVRESKLGAAASGSDLVLLEANALGETGTCALSGSRAAAAVARDRGRPVWVVAGTGRVLPAPLWEALLQRISHEEPWDDREEIVPLHLIDRVLGPAGALAAAESLARADCPSPSELTRPPGPTFGAGGGGLPG